MHDILYTTDEIKETYEQVHDQLYVRYIIKNYSTNKKDIRDCALQGLDLSYVKKVLDIGCGYGFFIEKLKGLLKDDAIIIGVDVVENNREPFLHSAGSINYKGEFIASRADIIKRMPQSSFDFIISSYSLYFFPHLIPEISRVLAPGGIFLALTHSQNSLKELLSLVTDCMNKIGIADIIEPTLNKLFMAFSIEAGSILLKEYFQKIEKIEYKNAMLFPAQDIGDCFAYMINKKKLLYKDILGIMPERIDELMKCMETSIFDYSKMHGMMIITKDDGIFRCFKAL